MTAFSLQRGQLHAALVNAGFAAHVAESLVHVLCNAAQEMHHSGVLQHDTTPAQMKLVTPDVRKHHLTNLEFRKDDPDFRPPIRPVDESAPVPVPEPNVTRTIAPQQTDGTFRVAASNFTHAAGAGDTVSVGINATNNSRNDATTPIAVLDSRTNRVIGKELAAATNDRDGRLDVQVTESADAVTVHVDLLNLTPMDVVTGIKYVEGQGFFVTYRRVTAWTQGTPAVLEIPQQSTPVVTEMVEDLIGLRGTRKTIPHFGPAQFAAPSYFNTFRVLTFKAKDPSESWPLGEIKMLQPKPPIVCPPVEDTYSGALVGVRNVCRTIPEIEPGDELWVLAGWYPGTDSASPTGREESDQAWPGVRSDAFAYYADPAASARIVGDGGLRQGVWLALHISSQHRIDHFEALSHYSADELSGFTSQNDEYQCLSHHTFDEKNLEDSCPNHQAYRLKWLPSCPTVVCNVEDDWEEGSTAHLTVATPGGSKALATNGIDCTNLTHDVPGGTTCLATQAFNGKWYLSEGAGWEQDVVTDVTISGDQLIVEKAAVKVLSLRPLGATSYSLYNPSTSVEVDVVTSIRDSGCGIDYYTKKLKVLGVTDNGDFTTVSLSCLEQYTPYSPTVVHAVTNVYKRDVDTVGVVITPITILAETGTTPAPGLDTYFTLGEIETLVSKVEMGTGYDAKQNPVCGIRVTTEDARVLRKGNTSTTLLTGTQVSPVTALTLAQDGTLEITNTTMNVLCVGDVTTITKSAAPGVAMDVVTGLTLDASGLQVAKKTQVKVLSAGVDASTTIAAAKCP